MAIDTDLKAGRRPGLRLGRFRLVAIGTFLIVVTGFWVATKFQSDCEAAARLAFFGYTEALNSGDGVLAAQYFADAGNFSWYSEKPGRLNDDARLRDSLADYLSDRAAQDARLRVLFFDFNGESSPNVLGHFGFYALNESWEMISGKGAVSCATGKVAVLSIGSA